MFSLERLPTLIDVAAPDSGVHKPNSGPVAGLNHKPPLKEQQDKETQVLR